MKLHEMEPDDILSALEARQDAYINASEAESRAEAAHKSMEAAVYKAHRSNGKSIEDSKMALRENDSVAESLDDLITKQTAAARCRAGVERAKLATELWRTVRADSRRV